MLISSRSTRTLSLLQDGLTHGVTFALHGDVSWLSRMLSFSDHWNTPVVIAVMVGAVSYNA